MLSNVSIEKYREIYKAEFGRELSFDDAVEQAQRLLNLARIVMQPMPKRFEARYRGTFEEQHVREEI